MAVIPIDNIIKKKEPAKAEAKSEAKTSNVVPIDEIINLPDKRKHCKNSLYRQLCAVHRARFPSSN